MALSVQMNSTTWSRNSHGLFDYESLDVHKNTFEVTEPVAVVRTGNSISVMAEDVQLPKGSNPLIRLTQRNGTFAAENISHYTGARKPWLVVRDLPEQRYKLEEGDNFKLGRFKFRVRQLAGLGESVQLELDKGQTINCEEEEKSASKICRICLEEGARDDVLLSPCACKGTIQYVHFRCLRNWVRNRVDFTEGGFHVYKTQRCELCKKHFPKNVRTADGQLCSFVETPEMVPPFIVLECAGHHERGQALHVASLAQKRILKLGRGHLSDVRFDDMSLSRWHATIRISDGRFYLEDNKSKFGTLVAMKPLQLLDVESFVSVQVGQTVLSMTVRGPGKRQPGSSGQEVQVPKSSQQQQQVSSQTTTQSTEEQGRRPTHTQSWAACAHGWMLNSWACLMRHES